MIKKKLNVKRLVIVLLIPIVITAVIIYLISNKKMKQSIEYKLGIIGYSESEVSEIKNLFNSEEIDYLLSISYSDSVISLSKDKNFKFKKLNDYLNFMQLNKSMSLSEVILRINTHTDKDFYEIILNTDTSKNELMIVNKVYRLNEEFEPNDLIIIPSTYAYSGKYCNKITFDALSGLIDSAKEAGYKLVVTQGYRSYKDQSDTYDNYKMNNGIKEADIFVARAGHSDYQTGYSIDIEPYNKKVNDITTSEEYAWLKDNSYKFGFIQRFPEGKEALTGFKYNPWRLRYVGLEAATYIYQNKITLEEYYSWKFE